MLLAMATSKNWFLHPLYINNIFFHDDLHEEVYMTLPPKFQTAVGNQVCRLKKSLYGLKQAIRQWHFKLTEALKTQSFKQAHSDSFLFFKNAYSCFITLIIYVDDVTLGNNDMHQIQLVKNYLHERFKIKDLGELKFFLGLEVARSATGINIC